MKYPQRKVQTGSCRERKKATIQKLLLSPFIYLLFFSMTLAPEGEPSGWLGLATILPNAEWPGTEKGGPTAFSGQGAEFNFSRLPLYFIPNKGQLDRQVAYYVQGQERTLFFTREGMTIVLHSEMPIEVEKAKAKFPFPPSSRRWVVKVDFVDAEPGVKLEGHNETSAVISYFKGNPGEWQTGIPTYSRIVYHNLWKGIDLAYSGDLGRLKGEFILYPGADPSQIRLAYRGITKIALNERGQLEVETPAGLLVNEAPIAYQEIDGRKIEIAVNYVLTDTAKSQTCSFKVGDYNPAYPLVIDPVGVISSSLLGGADDDIPFAISIDKSGKVYVAGLTRSSSLVFPALVGPDESFDCHPDAFVVKIDASGEELIYGTYIGGSDMDVGYGIAVDSKENVYFTGYTYSDENSFPVKAGPGLVLKGLCDAFVAKIDASGTGLAYCGYIGGSNYDVGYGIAIDGYGNAYITGETRSLEDTFPVTGGPDLTHNKQSDVFVAKVNATGTGLIYCGYIGGSYDDKGHGIALDKEGNAYVIGDTNSSEASFPVYRGPDLTFNNRQRLDTDAFVAKVNPSGSTLVYCGYIGGMRSDSGKAIAVDSSGNAYVAGETNSNEESFPVRTGPGLFFKGNSDAFVAKVHSSGSILIYCGYIGGSGRDGANGIAVSPAGSVYVTGYTSSSENTFPVIVGPDLTYNGNGDAFVAKVNSEGTTLDYCSYLGSADEDIAHGIALDDLGTAYVTGRTEIRKAISLAQGKSAFSEDKGNFAVFMIRIFSASVLPIFDGCNYEGKKAVSIAVWRPSDQNWYIKDSAKINFGLPGDIPVPGDYDGDGKTDIAVYRPATGNWIIRNQFQVAHGLPGDIPVPGDYDGDGKTDIAVYRPATGIWLVKDKFTVSLGGSADIPVPGDYDSNGTTDFAVFNAVTGLWRVKDQFHAYLGTIGDIPVPGDYNGDGKADVAIFRPSDGLWMVKDQFRLNFGTEGDIPVPGDYDGNGTADIAIFRPSQGLWAIKDQFQVHFGKPGDIPLVR